MKNQILTGYPSIDKPWLKYYSEENIRKQLPKVTMYTYIKTQNNDYQDNTVLMYFGKAITYQTLFESIDRAANAFLSAGIKAGDIVSMIAITTPELIYAIYGLNKIGAVCNMLDPRMPEDAINASIEQTESKYILLLDIYADKIKVKINETQTVIILSMAESMPVSLKTADTLLKSKSNKGYITWQEFIDTYHSNWTAPSFVYQENWPALIEYTGGTTGESKGVVLSNDNINAVAHQYARTGIDLDRNQSWQTVAAPFIAYAFITSMHLPLSYGMVCKITIYDPESIAIDTVKNDYDHITANPLVWETIIHFPEAQNKDFSHLIAPITGADYMSPKLEKEVNLFLKSRGCKWGICQGYGLTEVASGVSVNILKESDRTGSVGIPFIDTTISIFDVDTYQELPYGKAGEVCISGPTVMLGYFRNKKATDDMIKRHADGTVWLHSGDIGRMDEDGFLFIEGRIKRMLVQYNGAKVFPFIIEKVIMEDKAVEKCCVVGVQDLQHTAGQIPVANIILRKEFSGQEKDIEARLKVLCRHRLPDYAEPAKWLFMESFPLTPIGKVDYRSLEQMAQKAFMSGVNGDMA